ncbi:MAG TPA: MaoC/PaaZ C-terminal domain-containing protein [Acidimicrobiales bacterium]|nr:MaoC/PaaZ C-terminal domain-containing protein [Acidimicrobiales bacterium]
MAISPERLGIKTSPRRFIVDGARAQQYADATNDPNLAYAEMAPPVFAVVPAFEALGEAASVTIPPEAMLMVVHGEQDMHFYRPILIGEVLDTMGEAYSIRVGSSGTRVTFRVLSNGEDGAPIVESYATLFVRAMTDGDSAGPDKPDHTFPESARSDRVGTFSVHVDDDQTFRYSKASGDLMPIHLDDNVAKSVGLPGIIAHGLCTMAMCGQAVLKLTADNDPERLKRLAVRFSKNVFPGNDIVTEVFRASQGPDISIYAFEATSAGSDVVKNGWAQIRD